MHFFVAFFFSFGVSLFSFVDATSANAADKNKNPWKLRPFTTDGCTMFSNGTKSEPDKWHHCCYKHDVAYWAGGSFSQRRNADLEFSRCLKEAGEPTLAVIGYIGVRLGGTAVLPTPHRWAYGWTGVRGYWSLNPEEQLEVQKSMPSSEQFSGR
jgi:hypothetical protein